jgi:excisionase family DNA binding protein
MISQVSASNDTIPAKKAAELLGVSTWMLYELAKQRKVPHVRLGRMIRFRRTSLLAWLAEREAESRRSVA